MKLIFREWPFALSIAALESVSLHWLLALGIGVPIFFIQMITFFRARGEVARCSQAWESRAERARPQKLALSGLKERLYRLSSYELLKRLGVAAPLIGVFITALGIFSSPFASEEGAASSFELSHIQRLLPPLYLGVLVGVVLALINQLMLWMVHNRISQAILKFRSAYGYDEAAGVGGEEGIGEVTTNMSALAEKVSDSIVMIDETLDTLNEKVKSAYENVDTDMLSIGASCKKAADGVQASVGSFNKRLDSLANKLDTGLGSFEKRLNKSADTFEQANAKLKEEVGLRAGEIASAAKTFEKIDQQVGESVANVQTGVETFIESGSLLKQSTESLKKNLGELFKENRESLVENQQQLKSEVAKAAGQIESLGRKIQDLDKTFESAANTMVSGGTALSDVAKDVEEVAGTAKTEMEKSTARNTNAIQSSASKINAAADELKIAVEQFGEMSQKAMSQAASRNANATEAAASKITVAASDLQTSAEKLAGAMSMARRSLEQAEVSAKKPVPVSNSGSPSRPSPAASDEESEETRGQDSPPKKAEVGKRGVIRKLIKRFSR